MVIAVLNSVSASPGTNGGATGTIDSTGASLLVVIFSAVNTTTLLPTFTDSASNTWRALPKAFAGTANYSRMYYCANPTTSATHSVTVSGTSIFSSIAFYAVSGTDLISPLCDFEGIGSGAVGLTSWAMGTLTPPLDNCIIFATLAVSNTSTSISINSGMAALTRNGTGTAAGLGAAYIIQTTAAALSPTWSWTTLSQPGGFLAAFRTPSAGLIRNPSMNGGMAG